METKANNGPQRGSNVFFDESGDFDQRLENAEAYLQLKEYKKAEYRFNNLIKERPSDARLYKEEVRALSWDFSYENVGVLYLTKKALENYKCVATDEEKNASASFLEMAEAYVEYLELQSRLIENGDQYVKYGNNKIYVTGMVAGGIFMVPAILGLFMKVQENVGWGKLRWGVFAVGVLLIVLNVILATVLKKKKAQLDIKREQLQKQIEQCAFERKRNK